MAGAIHGIVAILALGPAALWPLYDRLSPSEDPAARHRQRVALSRRLVNPGLLLTLVLGIWAAADQHAFSKGYVAWGFIAVVAIGGLEGALVARGHRTLAATPAAGSDAAALAVRTRRAEWAITALVVVTIVVMLVKA
jgi:hypothetical protein